MIDRRNAMFLAWGTGSLGATAMIAALSFLALYYLVEVVGLGPAVAGLVLFVGKLIDLVAYPALGIASDCTRSRLGRRRPYLLAGAVTAGLCFVLAFSVPEFAATWQTVLYASLVFSAYALSLALFFVPYMAQPAEMTDQPTERNTIMAFRSGFLMLGTLVGSALAAILIEQFGGGRQGYQLMSVVVGVLITTSMFVAIRATWNLPESTAAQRPADFLRGLSSITASRPFLILMAVKFLQFLGMAAGSAVILFFITLVMGKTGNWLAWYGLGIILAAVAVMRGWVLLANRIGKKPVYSLALSLYALAMMSWLLAGEAEPLSLFLLRALAVGIGSAGLLVCGQSMLLDAIHADRLTSGQAREGTLMALYTFAEKVGGALGPLLVGLLLSAAGFQGGGGSDRTVDATARLALEIPLVWTMVVIAGLILWLLRYYRLDERSLGNAALARSSTS